MIRRPPRSPLFPSTTLFRSARVVVAARQRIRGKPDLGREAEVAALAGLAARADLAAHELHQPVADGQAQAGAAVAARGLDVGLGEGLEQPLGPRCIQAYADRKSVV